MLKKENKKGGDRCRNKKGQVTIFIIIAIIIIAAAVLFLVFRGKTIKQNIPANLEPIYFYYLSCIKEQASNGALLLGESGGYIEPIDFSPGSAYMPFSSHLGFMGNGIPYWHYISGNGIKKEQIPSKAKMQSQLNDFIEEGLSNCDFSEFERLGFEINFTKPSVEATIKDNSIDVNIKQNVDIKLGETTWIQKTHSATVNSNLGKFYSLASRIYKNEKETMFLENYGVDILRLYAPVDGSEIGCSTKIWQVNEIRDNLTKALESNTPAIKIKGDYYNLGAKENKYFVRDIGEKTDFAVNFLYSRDWPTKIEVWPSENDILRADPIGLQEGLGILGFCYVPYHFVYDFAYPVLIQIYSGNEMFQFPVVVSIDKNKPRKAANASGLPNIVPELCEHKNTKITVYTYKTNLEPVGADIKFKCFDTICDIGKTQIRGGDSVLEANFPQCENGFIIADAEGYETKKYLYSTINEGTASIVLDKKYKLGLELREKGDDADYGVITLKKEGNTITLAYPQQKEIEITEGQYEIKAYVYSNASIALKGTKSQKCVDIPKSGIFSIFGITEKKCFNLEIPDQVVDFAVSGGGIQNYYAAESELQDSKKLIIEAESFGVPTKLEELQMNYNNVETSQLNVRFEK